jgi:2-polyprenyl-3-methyl-5-hydroxy-6-metoxy-1,4-benzoquinol methylase
MLGCDDLAGKSFLDIGSGSGLFSLAARQLGASVFSFDYDAQSVACTQEMKRRYFTEDPSWTIEEGSALDIDYIRSLGNFDIVYSWGVLHHTGDMWEGLKKVDSVVKTGGTLFIAIYNDQGAKSRFWLRVKQVYNRLPKVLQPLYVMAVTAPFETRLILLNALRGKLLSHVQSMMEYKKTAV